MAILGRFPGGWRTKAALTHSTSMVVTVLDGLGRVRTLDAAALTPQILGKLDDWSGLMGRKVGQARQILRHVLDGRITFTPQADGRVEFVGYADPGPLFAATVLADLGKSVVSPTGFATCCDPPDPRRGAPAGRLGHRPTAASFRSGRPSPTEPDCSRPRRSPTCLIFTPRGAGSARYYEFAGPRTLRKVIAGLALQTEIVPPGKLSNGWRLPFDATA